MAIMALAFGAVTVGAVSARAHPGSDCNAVGHQHPPPACEGGWDPYDGDAFTKSVFFTPMCTHDEGYYEVEVRADWCPNGRCENRSWYWGENGQFLSYPFGDGTSLMLQRPL